jgi:adenylyltransferase/sulfurtransferase
MKKLIAMTTFLFLVIVGTSLQAGENGPKKISADELKAWQDKGEAFLLVDSRGGKNFDGEMIVGAKNLPVDQTTPEALAGLGATKDQKIVFYCSNTACNASELSGYKAISQGFGEVYKFPGGIEEWKEKGYPTVKQES